ncbi:hypothetical protein W97_04047 [Coniosporium apollinis CBS 100218]|uniref:LITAF domain-containing protein n=1 Tax=Coniosporium apollinis (strain CBS 100218) TaxID=1168221 RepID=R7YSJ1_CONA1|nr:uncharacterized protein W97_04047 [Coniosporium apollinis CBS 100218]EON64813.1 hypothetical protein W97_04047 [Coniosporium apollinis CBS 100218]
MSTYPAQPETVLQQPPVYHTGSPPPQSMSPLSPQHTQPVYDQSQMQQMGYQQQSPPQMQQQGQYFQPQQQQMMPQQHQMQPMQPGTVYQNATPIASLGRSAAPADCPACGQRSMTQTSYEVGNSTHAWALGLCCCLCLGCIPYLMNSLKDVQHKCGKCGVLLATWHRSGTTEVHIHN